MSSVVGSTVPQGGCRPTGICGLWSRGCPILVPKLVQRMSHCVSGNSIDLYSFVLFSFVLFFEHHFLSFSSSAHVLTILLRQIYCSKLQKVQEKCLTREWRVSNQSRVLKFFSISPLRAERGSSQSLQSIHFFIFDWPSKNKTPQVRSPGFPQIP
jgi:hypothetical protein